MRAAFRCRDRVAIGIDETIINAAEPGDRPFKRAMTAFLFNLSRKDLIGNGFTTFNLIGEIIFKARGKAEDRFCGNIRAFNKRGCA